MKKFLILATVATCLLVMGCKSEDGSITLAIGAAEEKDGPSAPSISINSGASSTTSQIVTLNLSATDNIGITAYYVSETFTLPSTITTKGWTSVTATTSLAETHSFTLSSGLESKTVYVWFQDAAGNVSSEASDSIYYGEPNIPSNGSITIAGGATSTTASTVNLELGASDDTGITAYFLSETATTPAATDSGWVEVTSVTSLTVNPTFNLSSSEATKTIYAWFKDATGNISAVASSNIIFTSSWTKQLGTAGADGGREVVVDASGNIYVAGYATGLMGSAQIGGQDAILTKYTESGTVIWTKQLGTAGADGFRALTLDASGNIYVTGSTDGNWAGTNAGLTDIYTAKYNSSGVLQWEAQLGGTGIDVGNGIATDSSGNVYVGGYVTAALPGHAFVGGSHDSFLLKYNSTGILQWSIEPGTTLIDAIAGVKVDSNGDILVTGWGRGSVNGAVNSGDTDLFVSKYNNTGTHLWSKMYGTTLLEADSVFFYVDSSNNIYVASDSTGSMSGQNAGGRDIVVLKLDSAGTQVWVGQLGTTAGDSGDSVVVDGAGNVYVLGFTTGALDGNALIGVQDVVLIKYDMNGIKQWTKQFGSTGTDSFSGIILDSNGSLILTGQTDASVDGQTALGLADMIIMKNPDGFLP